MDTTFDLWSLPWRALQRRISDEFRAESRRAASSIDRSPLRQAQGVGKDVLANVSWLARAQGRFT
jgi:hypothetical protein